MYLTLLLGMFCFLPIAGAWWLLPGAADFAVTLLALDPASRGFFYYKSLPLMPVITVAACAGYMRLKPWLRSRLLALGGMGAAGMAYVYFAALPLPWSLNMAELPVMPRFSLSPPDAEAVRAINTLVPPDARLGVQGNIGMFFNRRELYYFPTNGIQPLDYIILYLDSPWKVYGFYRCKDFVVYAKGMNALLDEPNLKIVYWQKPWLVISRLGEDIKDAHAEVKDVLAQFVIRQYQLCNIWNTGP